MSAQRRITKCRRRRSRFLIEFPCLSGGLVFIIFRRKSFPRSWPLGRRIYGLMDLLRLVMARQPLDKLDTLRRLVSNWKFIYLRLITVNRKTESDFAELVQYARDVKLWFQYFMYCCYQGELSSSARKMVPAKLLLERALFLRQWGAFFYFFKYSAYNSRVLWKALKSDNPEIQALVLAGSWDPNGPDSPASGMGHPQSVREINWTPQLFDLLRELLLMSKTTDNVRNHLFLKGYLMPTHSKGHIKLAELRGIVESQARGSIIFERNDIIESAISRAVEETVNDVQSTCILWGYFYLYWNRVPLSDIHISPLEVGLTMLNPTIVEYSIQNLPVEVPSFIRNLAGGLSDQGAQAAKFIFSLPRDPVTGIYLSRQYSTYLQIAGGLPLLPPAERRAGALPPPERRAGALLDVAHPDLEPNSRRDRRPPHPVDVYYDLPNLMRTNPESASMPQISELYARGQMMEVPCSVLTTLMRPWFGKVLHPGRLSHPGLEARYERYLTRLVSVGAEKLAPENPETRE